ncbi:aryl-sulfate sulfotransferase [Nannocystaceae bacterium ST9]
MHRFPSISPAAALLVLACVDQPAGAASNEASEDGNASETASDTSEGPPRLLGDPELITYRTQPMVVDVEVTLDSPGESTLSHDTDPGIHVGAPTISDEGRTHRFRVRGLAPETEHPMTLAIVGGDSHPLTVSTLPPLSGFRPNFALEVTTPDAIDPSYRMFDYAYTPLFSPTGIFVIDGAGVTRWYVGGPPAALGATAIWAGIALRDDGTVLGLRDGTIIVLDELAQPLLQFAAADQGLAAFHHEVIELANGNFLTLGNSFLEVDYPDEGSMLVAGDLLVEFDPSGEVVWTWDAFEHLDPQRRKADFGEGLGYLDPETGNYGYDWTHGNGMLQTPDDRIVLSMRHQDWVIAIEHASGEIVWRLGDEGDFALTRGAWFHHQHSPRLLPEGDLLIYDNDLQSGVPLADAHARVVRYALDLDAMTAAQVWQDDAEPFVSSVAGDVEPMPTDNLLVLDSTLQPDPASYEVGKNFSRLRELDLDASPMEVWSLTTQQGKFIYRAIPTTRLPGEG